MKVTDAILMLYVFGKNIKNQMIGTIKNENGASTVEYALLIAVIVFGVIGAATFMIPQLQTMFLDVVKKIAELAAG